MIHGILPKKGSSLLKCVFFLSLVLWAQLGFAQTVDCSVNANCSDSYCQFASNIERGCNCFDNIDNDNDGKIDKADPNCATYYGLIFVGEGSDCSIVPPGSADPFDLVDVPIMTAQNTADTQSKIAVGDVDGDGIPDAVITSKWNRELRVVATSNGQPDGSAEGDIKADFKTTGQGANIFSGTGGCSPNKLLFEHEVMIADIDGNGTGEIFGIVSNRGGNPSTPPTCFYLVGFTYSPATLTPLWNAIPVGPDRVGIPGIADMDGDGTAEIYFRDRIYAAETGKLLASGGGNWDLDVVAGPVAVNISGDNTMELVCGTKIYGIPSLTNRNPASPAALTLLHDMNALGANDCYVKLMIDPVEYGQDTHSSCSVADIDRDGNMDVVITGALNSVSGPTTVFYWNVAKSRVTYFSPPDPAYVNGWPWGTSRVNLGDANGDGETDLSFVAGNRLWCLKTDPATGALSSLWASFRTINDSRSGIVAVTIYDFNNDGEPEMVYRDSQELAVIDGATGTTKIWSSPCQSHTYTEGPIVADVNGDGATDICVTCATAKFDILDPIQQQALGQFRLYYSSGNEWLPTRKVWNQPGYFVVNINDDLTLPFPQLDQNLIFGEADCPNGLPGPQMPLNVFLNQVPFLSANGCPVFPAPDLSFSGDNPDTPGVDTDGDGIYQAAVEVVPPICGDLGISVRFRIINDGDLPITASIPVSFFIGDPTDPGITSDSLLHSTTLNINNLQVDSTFTSSFITFNGSGSAFRLYIVLNNDGSVLPIQTAGSSPIECRIDNNIYSAFIQPDPFVTKIEKVKDNFKCINSAPDNGELRVRIFKGGVEVNDYSQYAFQWYTGTAASHTAIAGATNYNITDLAEGDYTAIVTNTAKGCVGIPVDTTILREGNDPEVVINVVSHQTVCNPPNGELRAEITGGNTGFTFEWFDIALNPLGISGPTANNLVAGNYLVRVSRDGCTKNSLPQTVDGPVIPDAQAETLQNVEDCLNPNSGSITATAIFNGAPQDPANYSFDWYMYDNATFTRGSILPGIHGTGPTRTGLPVGHYEVVITDLTTQCTAEQPAYAEVTSATILPTAILAELAPLTSCDPANPNGRMQASVEINGVAQDPADFTFEWFKGDNTLAANAHNDVTGVNGSIAESVSGGGVFYTVRVTTGNNCSDTEKLIITEDLNIPEVTLVPTNNGICDPALASATYSGTVTASVTFDGVAVADFTNYQVTWHNGSLATDPVIAGETTTFLDERNGGFYTAVVERTDLGCVSAPVTAEVLNAVTLPTILTDSIPSTNCAGGTPNGGVTVTAVIPADTYTYRWFDASNILIAGATTNAISGRQGGPGQDYTVEVTLGSTGCRNTFTTNIPDNKLMPVLALTPADNSICDGALGFNGSISSSFNDANAQAGHTYAYVWSAGSDMTNPIVLQTGPSLTQRGGGFYTATIRNIQLNCTSSPVTTEILNNQILPAISAAPIPSTNCPDGADNGAITASVTNGLAGQTFAFQWSKGNLVADPDVPAANGGNTATITGQEGNQNYIVLVRNNQTGCENTFIQALADNSQVPVLTLVTTDNSICDPALGYNGTVSRDVITDVNANGTDTYTFAWSSGTDMLAPISVTNEANPTLTGQNGGFYTVTVTNDRLGCTSNPVTAEVNNNQILPAISAVPTPSTNCPGGADNGGVTASVTNALAGQTFSFAWHKGGLLADPAVPNAKGGNTATIFDQQGNHNYIVAVTNNQTGCENTLIQTIADHSVVPVLTLVTTDNSICDETLGFNGTVSRDAINDVNSQGTDTYTYIWSTGSDMSSPISVADPSSPTLTGQDGGFYTVTVENDRLGCVSNPVTAQVINNQIFPAIDAVPTPSTNCPGGTPNGRIDVSIGNAVAGQTFSFDWFAGTVVTDPPVPAVNGGQTASVTAIQGGTNYLVLATNDQTGCSNTFIQLLADNSEVPVLTLTTTDNSICDPTLGFNGSITQNTLTDANAQGTDTYTYAWSTGMDMSALIGGQSAATLSGREGGFFTATVRNNRLNCVSNPVTVEILNNQLIPAITATPVPSTNCDPALANGEITVAVTNGLAGQTFTFEWHKGNLMTDPAVAAADGGTSDHIIRQQGGTNYVVEVVINETGCSNTFVQPLQDVSTLPVLTLTPTPNTICVPNPDYDGSVASSFVDVNTDAGHVYEYEWSEGSDMSQIITGEEGSSISQLEGGFYTARIINTTLGCASNPVITEVADNLVLPALAVTPTPSTNCAGGDANGEITANVTNGLGGQTFSFLWFRGSTTTDPAVAAAQGGNSPTIFDQQGGQFFTVEATVVQTGCANTTTLLLQDDSEVPVITPLGHTDNINCTFPFNGTAFVDATTPFTYRGTTITGPYAGFTLTWSGGTVQPSLDEITELAAGTYTLQVTAGAANTVTNNNDNCISSPMSITILDDLVLPLVDVNVTNQTSCDPAQPNGQLEALETSGVGSYAFDWHAGIGTGGAAVGEVSDGLTNPTLTSGDYTVLVRNTTTRCETMITSYLPDNIVLPGLSLAQSEAVTNCTAANGEITATPVVTNLADGDFTIYYLEQNTTNPNTIKTDAASFSSANVADLVYGNLAPGYYAGLVRDEITHCESNGVVVQVMDATVAATITIDAVVAATFCGDDAGSIDVSITGGNGPYIVNWYDGGPTNPGPFDFINSANEPTFAGAPRVPGTPAPGTLTAEDLWSLEVGLYTIVVEDQLGCGTVLSNDVPFLDAPVITLTPTNSTQCDPLNGDGQLQLDVDVSAVAGPTTYSYILKQGLNPATAVYLAGENCVDGIDNDGDGDTDLDDSDCDISYTGTPDYNQMYAALNPSGYVIEIVDHTAGCSVFKNATIRTDAVAPVITLGTITPNTTCPGEIANFADGSVEVTISKDPLDVTAFVPVYEITSITATTATPATNPALFPLNIAPTTPTVLFTNPPFAFNGGFSAQSYTINVLETTSGCTAQRIVNIPDQPAIPQLLEVDVTNDSFCAPLSNGSAEVVTVNPVGVADYDYTWYTDPALTTTFYAAPGTGAGGGELLNATKNPAWMNPLNGQGMGTREYYVRGVRRPGTGFGAGCPTPSIKVVIQDEHVAPVSLLSSLPNTSCDPAIGEGSISISTTTASPDPLVLNATYRYDLESGGVPVTSLNTQPGALSTPFTALLDNAAPYSVITVNEVNGCVTTNSITVSPAVLPLQITDHTFSDQLICYPNGDIQVTEIQIDRSAIGQGVQTFGAALAGDFDFQWFRAAPATPGTFDPATPLQDNTPADINREILEPGTAGGQYPTMGAGTYYVIATRIAGPTVPVVGQGCPTPPLRVDIDNLRINPVVTLAPFSNTSCSSLVFEGEIDVDVTDASPASFGPFDYTYAWAAVTSGTTPGPLTNPYTGVSATDGPFVGLEQGDYTIEVTNNQTGCQMTAITTILKNTTPIFVTETEILPQLYCDPSGRIEVTQIKYEDRNGVQQIAPLADFNFSWTRTGTGAVGTALPLLDSTNYAGIGADMYAVFATRTAGSPGRDCQSAPVNLQILDKSVDPVLTLTPFSNTSCTTVFEGEIEVDITDASVPKVPATPFSYDYIWADVDATGLALPANDAGQSGVSDLYSGLEHGAYRLNVTNTVTGCTTQATTTIIQNRTPVFIQDVTMVPQFYCDPSGNLNVVEVTFNDRDGITQNGPLGDFTYTWSRSLITNIVATTDPTAPAPGHIGTELDSIVYNPIGADSYWVVATRQNGTPGAGCASAPFRIDIGDKRVNPVITLTPFSNTSCTTTFEGEIEVDIADGSVSKTPPAAFAYNYTWNAVNPPGLALPPNQLAQTGVDNVYAGLEDGTYRLTAVNSVTGCSAEATTTIIRNQTPVFLTVVNPTPQFYCDPSGRLEITEVNYNDRDGNNVNGLLSDFTFTWARGTTANTVATTIGSAPRGAFLDSLVYAGIGYDPDYYVVATRTNGSPGAGCSSAPIKVEITDKREYPSIVLTPFSNTSCTTAFEGEIEINITDASAPKVLPSADAGLPILYDYTWADVNAAGLTLPPADAGQTGSGNIYQSLEDGSYRLTAVNTITGCSSNASTTIIRNQTPVFVQDVDMMPQFYCTPSGHLEVRSVTFNDRDGVSQPGPLADFVFNWTRNDLVTAAGITDGSQPRGTFLDSLSYVGPGTIGTGTYYVVATRNTGAPGAGCESAPFRIDIADERENPVIAFNTVANTACDNNFDGRITVISSTSNAPGAGANYDISWPLVPAGNVLTPANDVGTSYTTPLTDIIGPGLFTVQVTNRVTGCSSQAVVEMFTNPQPVEILTVDKVDQMICFPDGSITVSAVKPALVTDYSFNWFRGNTGTTALVDGTSTTITSASIDNTNYASIAADTYFVVGRKTTAGGSGCLTPPFRVDLEDLHVDPAVGFSFTPNSSCDPTDPNGQLIASAFERDGDIENYTFVWTLNSAPLPGVTTQLDASPTSQLDNAFEGQYALVVTNTVTGCDFTSGLEVNLDLNVSLPNIITVDTFDPLDCLASGSAEVTAISIGGGPSITGPVLGTDFQYEWYESDFVPANQLPTTTPQLPGLNPGRFFVRVQDLTTDCKSAPTEVVILDDDIVYPVVTIRQTALQISCVTTTGTAALEARGDNQTDANPNYQFQWFNNLDNTPPNMATTSLITDLVDGDYSVTVTNSATGCSSTNLYIIRDDSERFMPELSVNTMPRTDCLDPNGVLLVREVGYDPNSGYPYPVNFTTEYYAGANADVSQPGTAMALLPGFNRNWEETSMDVGVYTVKITDNNTGCFIVATDDVGDLRTPPVVVIVQDNPLINCDPARPNGQISATADNGRVGGYQFDWYSGTTATGAVISDNNKLIGIGMGDYTVRVTNDITHCFADATSGVTDGRLPAPTPTATLVFDRTRCDYPDGWVTADVGGITFNYAFHWYDGGAAKPVPDFKGVNYKDRDIGTYTVTAMDQVTGCLSAPVSVEVKDMRVIPQVIIHTTPSYCEELPGSEGGTGTAQIELDPSNVVTDDVTWTIENDGSVVGIGSYLTNVLPGFYQANIVTAQGCPAAGVGEVKTEVFSYNLVSNNGDRKNDNFRIDCISQFPNNNVKIFNRSGVLVYEADGYNNDEVVFKGIGERGVYAIGNDLPVGTYFYIIDKRDGSKPKTGYLELVR